MEDDITYMDKSMQGLYIALIGCLILFMGNLAFAIVWNMYYFPQDVKGIVASIEQNDQIFWKVYCINFYDDSYACVWNGGEKLTGIQPNQVWCISKKGNNLVNASRC